MKRRSGWWQVYHERQRAKHEARKARELIERGIEPSNSVFVPWSVYFGQVVLNAEWMAQLDAIETK